VRCPHPGVCISGRTVCRLQSIATFSHGWLDVGPSETSSAHSGRQLFSRQCFGSVITSLGLFWHLLRGSLPARPRIHCVGIRKVWTLLWHSCLLWILLRILHDCVRTSADTQCLAQRRARIGDYHWFTDRSSVTAQHRPIHFRRLDEPHWLAFWIRLHPQLLGSGMDHLQLRLRGLNLRGSK
jgi:hypothetical protein